MTAEPIFETVFGPVFEPAFETVLETVFEPVLETALGAIFFCSADEERFSPTPALRLSFFDEPATAEIVFLTAVLVAGAFFGAAPPAAPVLGETALRGTVPAEVVSAEVVRVLRGDLLTEETDRPGAFSGFPELGAALDDLVEVFVAVDLSEVLAEPRSLFPRAREFEAFPATFREAVAWPLLPLCGFFSAVSRLTDLAALAPDLAPAFLPKPLEETASFSEPKGAAPSPA
ncbi:MAG: hypothetical protein LBJ64_07985 [Deltaproteobacteria bacterium]|jgi:hypothetical protein|nr:hypothetical protein [Deltaproteobacteria bacterium]